MTIGFADPWVLALLALPLAAFAYRARRAPPRARVTYSDTTVLDDLARTPRARIPRLLQAARVVGVLLATLALARPQAGLVEERISREGIDILFALDISSSMRAEDFQPLNRLGVAKQVIQDFVGARTGDRLGLVVFAARALTKSPLVLDGEIVRALVDEVTIGELEDGTAIGTAIATSINRLRAGDGTSKVLVLLTDGVNNRGEMDPITAARLAAPLGIRIHTIGVGTEGTAPYPARDAFGRTRYVNVPVEIDEDSLIEIAGLSGGRYFRATDASTLADIFAEIDRLETSPAEVLTTTRHRELFPWLLVPALLLVGGAEALRRTRYRVLP